MLAAAWPRDGGPDIPVPQLPLTPWEDDEGAGGLTQLCQPQGFTRQQESSALLWAGRSQAGQEGTGGSGVFSHPISSSGFWHTLLSHIPGVCSDANGDSAAQDVLADATVFHGKTSLPTMLKG